MLNSKRKKLIAISFLFPNSEQSNHGVFVLNRLKAMNKYVDITVINPIADSFIHKSISRYAYLSKIPEVEIIDGIKVYHPRFFSIPGHFKSIEFFTYRKAVKSVLDRIGYDFDLIDLHWTFPDLPCGYWLSKKMAKPFNVTLRGMEAFHQQDAGLRKYIVAHYLKKADKIVSLSNEMAQLADELASTAKKTAVIRNGVDTEKFYFMDQASCREKLGLALEEPIILGVGSLIHRKGFDLVINGLANIIATQGLEKTKFYILGSQGPEGDYRKELNQFIESHNLEQHVVFVGTIANQELVTWYNAADVFCLSSRGEGSPNVLTEALACGMPAVATKVGSVEEIMTSHKELGICVNSNDSTDICRGLTLLLLNLHDREAQAHALKHYDWDWCARKVMAFYNEKNLL